MFTAAGGLWDMRRGAGYLYSQSYNHYSQLIPIEQYTTIILCSFEPYSWQNTCSRACIGCMMMMEDKVSTGTKAQWDY